jgi:thymidylate kinase
MAEQGKLVVLEGTADAALGSLAESLCRWLREEQVAVEQTREPTYGPAGSQVLLAREPTHGPAGSRVLLARQGRLQFDPVSLALLCLADRLDHLQREDGILSWLDDGRWVVCVHYALSAYARQWGQVDWKWQRQIDASCRVPDLTLYVDLPHVEADPLRMAYLQAIDRLREEGQTVVRVDGRGAPDKVLRVCQRHVADLLGRDDAGAVHPFVPTLGTV